MFIGLGNYMPKLKQNYTIGIKVPWTLNSEENWNMTHRMAGKVYVVAGVISIIIALLNNVLSDEVTIIIFMAVFLVTGIGSVAYSFWLYKVKYFNKLYYIKMSPALLIGGKIDFVTAFLSRWRISSGV